MGTPYTFDEGMSCHSTRIELFYFDGNFRCIAQWVPPFMLIWVSCLIGNTRVRGQTPKSTQLQGISKEMLCNILAFQSVYVTRSAFQRIATIYRRVNDIIFQSERSVSK